VHHPFTGVQANEKKKAGTRNSNEETDKLTLKAVRNGHWCGQRKEKNGMIEEIVRKTLRAAGLWEARTESKGVDCFVVWWLKEAPLAA